MPDACVMAGAGAPSGQRLASTTTLAPGPIGMPVAAAMQVIAVDREINVHLICGFTTTSKCAWFPATSPLEIGD